MLRRAAEHTAEGTAEALLEAAEADLREENADLQKANAEIKSKLLLSYEVKACSDPADPATDPGALTAEQAKQLRAEVEARQSWIRAAAVLGAVAPWVILGLLALRPEAAAAYGSPQGIGLILGGAVVTVVAFRLMLRVGRLAEPRRWFA